MKRKFIILLIVILASGLVGISCGGSRAESSKNTNQAEQTPSIVDVTTATATEQNLPQYFEASGSLASDAATDVAPTIGGKVIAVNFDVGSYVQKGSVLVQLDNRDAQIRLEQAQAAVAQQQASVRQAEANVGQAEANVRQTQARLGLTEGSAFDLETFSQVRERKAQLDLAERELKRNERLVETGDVPRSQYDQRKATRDQIRAQLDEARSTAAVAVSAIRTAQSAVKTAQQAVGQARAGVTSAQTQVESAQKAINDNVIYAPLSGSISERNADVGEFIGTTGKVATIVRTNPLRMRIEVPEQDVAKIGVGQSISLNTSAYPDRQFSGVIARVLPNLNATSRTLIAEAEVNNIDGLLKPGQFATVKILLPESRPAVLIPIRAVRRDGTTNAIFVIKENRAELRNVLIGEPENDLVEVKNGLRPDEKVAVSNLELLTDGIEIRQ